MHVFSTETLVSQFFYFKILVTLVYSHLLFGKVDDEMLSLVIKHAYSYLSVFFSHIFSNTSRLQTDAA